jgi:TetR/AcrR family fatty acid metabolism transcriptional regulator
VIPEAATTDETRSKRQAIIEAARDLFAKQGYEHTTIAQIARAAGVAVGTVYLYFENKRQVLLNVSMTVHETIVSAMQSPELLTVPQRAVPRLLIEKSFQSCHNNMRVMGFFDLDVQTRAEAQQLQSKSERITEALDSYFRYLVAQGLLQPFDTLMYAKLINTLVEATLKQCFVIENGQNEAAYRERLIELVERLFFGPSLQQGMEAPGEKKNTATSATQDSLSS